MSTEDSQHYEPNLSYFWIFRGNYIGLDQSSFVGLMDDFRVYNDAFTHDEVKLLYGNGLGDLVIESEISVDPVIEGDYSSGSVIFTSRGQPVVVNSLSASNLAITNGSIVEKFLSTDDNITWTFSYSLEEENQESSISLNEGAFADPYGVKQ